MSASPKNPMRSSTKSRNATISIDNVSYSNANDAIQFTLSNVDVSIANGLRRTIIADVPVAGMRGFPHAESKINIIKNNTNFNNEFIKTRLSCIPIYTEGLGRPNEEIEAALEVHVSVQNNTIQMTHLTTEDFRVYDKGTQKYLDEAISRKMFPPNSQTAMYIDILRLRPAPLANASKFQANLSVPSNVEGDAIEFKAGISFVSANTDATFNATSTCAYSYTPDPEKLRRAWDFEAKKYASKEEADAAKTDWEAINRQRNYVPNSFDFIVETVGPIPNEKILVMACDILAENVGTTVQFLSENRHRIGRSKAVSEFCYDVKFPDQHTVGKIFERTMYRLYMSAQVTGKDETDDKPSMQFCAFVKEHPHYPDSIIRVAFDKEADVEHIIRCFDESSKDAIESLIQIRRLFSGAAPT